MKRQNRQKRERNNEFLNILRGRILPNWTAKPKQNRPHFCAGKPVAQFSNLLNRRLWRRFPFIVELLLGPHTQKVWNPGLRRWEEDCAWSVFTPTGCSVMRIMESLPGCCYLFTRVNYELI